jgi:hypothetical protein
VPQASPQRRGARLPAVATGRPKSRAASRVTVGCCCGTLQPPRPSGTGKARRTRLSNKISTTHSPLSGPHREVFQACRSAAGPCHSLPAKLALDPTLFQPSRRERGPATLAFDGSFLKLKSPGVPVTGYRNYRHSLIVLRALLLDADSAVPLLSATKTDPALCVCCYCPCLHRLLFWTGPRALHPVSRLLPRLKFQPLPQQPPPLTSAGLKAQLKFEVDRKLVSHYR